MITQERQQELAQKLKEVGAGKTPVLDQAVPPDRQAMLAQKLRELRETREPKQEPGMLEKIGRGVLEVGKEIARPVVKLGVTGAAAVEDTLNLVSGNKGAVLRTAEGYNVPGFGRVTPAKIGQDIEIKKDESGVERMTGGGLGRETLKTVGTGAEIAALLAGGGTAAGAKGTAGAVGKGLGQRIVTGATQGAAMGGVGGFGYGAQKEDATAGDILASTAKGAAFGGVVGGAIPAVGAATKGTQQAISKAPGKAKELAEGAMEKGRSVFGRKTLPAAEQADLLAKGVPDARVATKAMEGGKVVTDKAAAEVVRQGIPEADVALMKSGNSYDRKQMLKSLDIRERGIFNKKVAMSERAADPVGHTAIEEILKPVEKLNRKAGEAVGIQAKALGGHKLDPTDAIVKFGNKLQEAGVRIKNGALEFPMGSRFYGLKGVQNKINLLYKQVNRLNKTRDALQAHNLKQWIDDQVEHGVRAEGSIGYAEDVLKEFRHNIDSILDQKFPMYNKANIAFKESMEQLEQMAVVFGKRFKTGNSFADTTVGREMRSLLSNRAKRDDMLSMLDGMQKLLEKNKIKPKGDIYTQVGFMDTLERLLGTEAPMGHAGQIENAITQARGLSSAGGKIMGGKPLEGTLEAAGHFFNMTRGVTQENQIKAIKAFLKQEVSPKAVSNFGRKAIK